MLGLYLTTVKHKHVPNQLLWNSRLSPKLAAGCPTISRHLLSRVPRPSFAWAGIFCGRTHPTSSLVIRSREPALSEVEGDLVLAATRREIPLEHPA